MSLDGFVAGPKGEMDWVFASFDEAVRQWEVETLWQAGLHIMGARTFRDMSAWWPTSTEPYSSPMNQIPKAVFTRSGLANAQTTTSLENAKAMRPNALGKELQPGADSWRNAYIATGDLREEVGKLKRQDGDSILAHGGAAFARSLVAAGLVDEFRLLVHPVALGVGMPIFSGVSPPQRMKSCGTTCFPSGTVAQIFRPVNS
jgi:dihydrofolate reductase